MQFQELRVIRMLPSSRKQKLTRLWSFSWLFITLWATDRCQKSVQLHINVIWKASSGRCRQWNYTLERQPKGGGYQWRRGGGTYTENKGEAVNEEEPKQKPLFLPSPEKIWAFVHLWDWKLLFALDLRYNFTSLHCIRTGKSHLDPLNNLILVQ